MLATEAPQVSFCTHPFTVHHCTQHRTAFGDTRLSTKRLWVWIVPLFTFFCFVFGYGVFLTYSDWMPKWLWSAIFVGTTLHLAYTLWCFAACVFSYTGVRPDVYDELRKLAPGVEDVVEACKVYGQVTLLTVSDVSQCRVGLL